MTNQIKLKQRLIGLIIYFETCVRYQQQILDDRRSEIGPDDLENANIALEKARKKLFAAIAEAVLAVNAIRE
jgi:hypothetical protein